MVVENQLISTATPMIKLLSLRGFFNPTRITINNYSRREINAFYYIFPERDKLFNSRRDCYKSNNFWETKIISLVCLFGGYLKFKDNIASRSSIMQNIFKLICSARVLIFKSARFDNNTKLHFNGRQDYIALIYVSSFPVRRTNFITDWDDQSNRAN